MASMDGFDLCDDPEPASSSTEIYSFSLNDSGETSPGKTNTNNDSQWQHYPHQNERTPNPDSKPIQESMEVTCEDSQNPSHELTKKEININKDFYVTEENQCKAQSYLHQSTDLRSVDRFGIEPGMSQGGHSSTHDLCLNQPGEILRNKDKMYNKELAMFHDPHPISIHQPLEMPNVPESPYHVSHKPSNEAFNMIQNTPATTENQHKTQSRMHQPFFDPSENKLGVNDRVNPYPQAAVKSNEPRILYFEAQDFIPCANPNFSPSRPNASRNKDENQSLLEQTAPRNRKSSRKHDLCKSEPQFIENDIIKVQGIYQLDYQAHGNEPSAMKQSSNVDHDKPTTNQNLGEVQPPIADDYIPSLRVRMVFKWLSQNEFCNGESSDLPPGNAIKPLNQSLEGQLSANKSLNPIPDDSNGMEYNTNHTQSQNTMPPNAVPCYNSLRQFVYHPQTEDVNIFVYAPDQISSHLLILTFIRQSQAITGRPPTYSLPINVPRCGIVTNIHLWHIADLLENLYLMKSSARSARSVIILVFSLTTAQMFYQFKHIHLLIDFLRSNISREIPIVMVGCQVDRNNAAYLSSTGSLFNLVGFKIKTRYDLCGFLECSINSLEAVDSVILTAIDVSSLHKI